MLRVGLYLHHCQIYFRNILDVSFLVWQKYNVVFQITHILRLHKMLKTMCLFLPQNSWNTAKSGIKHQSINQVKTNVLVVASDKVFPCFLFIMICFVLCCLFLFLDSWYYTSCLDSWYYTSCLCGRVNFDSL